jgi:protein-disulfide isomerase
LNERQTVTNIGRWRRLGATLCIVVAAFTLAAAPHAQPLTQESSDGILKELLNELRQIRALLERQQQNAPAPNAMRENNDPVKVDIKGAYAIGRADAPVTMIAFIDYQCPFCKSFDVATYPRIKQEFIDTGKVRFVVRDLPLEALHPRAQKAAEATHCSADQGKYWEMREKLIVNTEALEAAAVIGYAREIGLQVDVFKNCLDGGKHAATVRRSVDQARELGIGGTPTFVIGKGSGDLVTGVKMVGALPYGNFDEKIRELLRGG